MKERVEDLVGRRARMMWVSTFHSPASGSCARRSSGSATGKTFSIYDAADQKRLMTLVASDLDLDPKRFPARALLHWVSNHKNELRDRGGRGREARNKLEETYAAAYALYQRRLRDANALDFDDLIMLTVHLFQALPDVRETYRRRFRHVLVDEYQDTNHAQYALIHQLCAADLEDRAATTPWRADASRAELMVVGDADQSIYAFRGANIRNILDFEDDFPDARTILLEQNYRSTQTILTAANAVISRNEGRKDKRLWSDAGDGERIVGYVADDERDEAQFVADEIDTLRRRRVRGRRTSRCSTAPTRRPVCSRRCSSAPASPTASSVGSGSTSAARSATRWPTCGCSPTRRRGLAAPDHQRAQARHRRPRDRLHPGPRRAGAAHLLGGVAPRRRGARPRHPVADRRCAGSWR